MMENSYHMKMVKSSRHVGIIIYQIVSIDLEQQNQHQEGKETLGI
jgi:hypothetical protein